MSDKPAERYDAIVIGGGPGGSTAAAVLADHGRRVVLFERELFPRYHVGESLLPYAYFPLKRLGLIEKMKESHFPKKHAVQFVSTDGKVATPFYFFNHIDHELTTTWQVLRSEFDEMLLANAQQQGAEIHQQTPVIDLLEQSGRVVGVQAARRGGKPYSVHAPMVIDASGRNAFAMHRNGWRKADPKLDRVACWTYFRGAKRDAGIDGGSTTVAYLPQKSWVWYIPLPDDMVSVGIVGEKEHLFADTKRPEDTFAQLVPLNPWIKEHLESGVQEGKYYGTRDFSYRSEYCAQDGLILVGDAFSFLDPVFSSGMYLALRGGELAGDAVHASLEAGDVSADLFQEYARNMASEIEAMRKLVYAFYDTAFSFGKLIRKHPHVQADLTDCLIGNLQKDFEPLFSAARELADLPEPLPYGRPRESVS